jgi:hypothetical protein
LKPEVQGIQATVRIFAEERHVGREIPVTALPQYCGHGACVLDVIVATLENPLAGLGVAFKKIAEKAKEETKGQIK